MNWKEIAEGWKNHFFPSKELKELIRATQEERLTICKDCLYNSTPKKINSFSKCNSCGCPLKQKSACLHCKCPIDKWLLVLTEEESKKINNQLNKEND